MDIVRETFTQEERAEAKRILEATGILEVASPVDVLKYVDSSGLPNDHKELLAKVAHRMSKDQDEHGVTRVSRALRPEISNEESLQAFVRDEEVREADNRIPKLREDAVKVWTIRLPYVENPQGPEDYELELIEEASRPRYCLGGHMQQSMGQQSLKKDKYPSSPFLRMINVEVILPPAEGLEQSNKFYGKYMPPTDGLDPENTGAMQQDIIEAFLQQFMQDFELTFMDAEPIVPKGQVNSWTVSLMDQKWSQQVATGVKDAIYTSLLKSNAGYVGDTDKPDYRTCPFIVLQPETASIVSEAITGRPWHDKNGELVVDGHSFLLLGSEPEDDRLQFDTQFRAFTGDLQGDKTPTLSKGVTRPIKPEGVERGLNNIQQWQTRADFYLAEEREDMTSHDLQLRLDTAEVLLETVVDLEQDILILVDDDQVKVGTDFDGEALFVATHNTGDSSGEAPGQFRPVAGNSQLYQFLNMTGREKLADFVQWNIDQVARDQTSLPGIFRTASRVNAQKAEQIAEGKRAYQTGSDGLTDAITGGGIRLSGKAWRYALLSGEVTKDGGVQMLPSVKRRYDTAVASYLRRHILKALGSYGYSYFHFGTTNKVSHLSWGDEESPFMDPESINIPRCVTRKVNADDDGDMIQGVAAGINGMKVVMFWRYPCVDLPVFIGFPKGTQTPFDGQTKVERERFTRMLKIFDPVQTAKSAPLRSDTVTELTAQNAWRMQNVGAKEGTKKRKRQGPNTLHEGFKVAKAIGDLNMTGVLTRSLERIGELICMTQEVIDDGPDKLQRAARHLMHQLKGYHTEKNGELVFVEGVAQRTLQRIEDQLTAFKYDSRTVTEPEDLSKLNVDKILGPVFGPDRMRKAAGLTAPFARDMTGGVGFEEPSDAIPLQYHKEPAQYRRVLSEMQRERETSRTFEEYQGLREGGIMAEMLREIDFSPIVDALNAIETDRGPFVRVIQKKLDKFFKTAELTDKEHKQYMAEADYIVQMCREYRRFWREVIDTGQMMIDEAADAELMRDRVADWQSAAARQITLVMRAMSRSVSSIGLAIGIYDDWGNTISGGERAGEYRFSTSAGMSLLTGRMGEVLLPVHIEKDLQMDAERHAVVFCKGQDLPVETLGQPVPVDVRIDRSAEVVHIRKQDGTTFPMFVDKDFQLPPSENLHFTLARTNDRQGVLAWRMK